MNESSCYSTSLPAFGVSVLDFGYSNRYVVESHCCFNLHFPDDILTWIFPDGIWCGASFGLFAICISSLARYLLRSLGHFFNWVVCFLIVELWALCIFWVTVLCWMCLLQIFIFSRSVACLLIHLIIIFFFPTLLRYNWHITLCNFKVYNMLIWYTYILQYDHHQSVS